MIHTVSYVPPVGSDENEGLPVTDTTIPFGGIATTPDGGIDYSRSGQVSGYFIGFFFYDNVDEITAQGANPTLAGLYDNMGYGGDGGLARRVAA